MALTNKNEPAPFVELTQAAKDEMVRIGEALERSKGDAKAIKELGFNVDKLDEMISMGEKMRDVILKRLT